MTSLTLNPRIELSLKYHYILIRIIHQCMIHNQLKETLLLSCIRTNIAMTKQKGSKKQTKLMLTKVTPSLDSSSKASRSKPFPSSGDSSIY